MLDHGLILPPDTFGQLLNLLVLTPLEEPDFLLSHLRTRRVQPVCPDEVGPQEGALAHVPKRRRHRHVPLFPVLPLLELVELVKVSSALGLDCRDLSVDILVAHPAQLVSLWESACRIVSPPCPGHSTCSIYFEPKVEMTT